MTAKQILCIGVTMTIAGAILVDCNVVWTGWTVLVLGVIACFLCQEIDEL